MQKGFARNVPAKCDSPAKPVGYPKSLAIQPLFHKNSARQRRALKGETMNEFARHLYDTLILLGGRRDIAEMAWLLPHLELIDESAIDTLRQYNIDLQTSIKDRLVNVNKAEVQIATDNSGERDTSSRTSLPR